MESLLQGTDTEEREANGFATALLMPAEWARHRLIRIVTAPIDESTEIAKLATGFNVKQTMRFKLVNLIAIPHRTEQPSPFGTASIHCPGRTTETRGHEDNRNLTSRSHAQMPGKLSRRRFPACPLLPPLNQLILAKLRGYNLVPAGTVYAAQQA